MSAVLKPNERAALEVRTSSRRADLFEIARTQEGIDILKEEIQEVIDLQFDKICSAYGELDDLLIGQIVANCFATCGMRMTRARQAKEMRDELMPSWRSTVQP